MNKIVKMWWVCVSFVVITLMLSKETYAAEGLLTGPEVIRSGDTITVVLTTDVAGVLGMECTIVYDKSLLTLVAVKSGMPGWMAEQNGNIITAYDNELNNPTTGSNDNILSMIFDVKDDIAATTAINIGVSNIVLSDGSKETPLADVTYTRLISKPLSKNNKLSNIIIKEGTISPQFKPTVTSYNLSEVDYSVTTLDIQTVTEDANAIVEVKGNELKVGNNTVSIVVTAENGSQRIYTISVKRKQDPNYVAGADAALKSIELSQGILSPTFMPDNTEYVVYVPYEVKEISIIGTPRDEKALGVTNAIVNNLTVGENELKVICKAEDGTEKVYNIKVVRMSEYDGSEEEKETTTTDSTEETSNIEQETSTVESLEDSEGDNGEDKNEDDTNNIVWYVVWLMIGMGIGAAGCYYIKCKLRK